MRALSHRNFEKQVKKLKSNEKRKLKERLTIFLKDPENPVLNDHALKGKYQGCRSINITGDLRAIYRLVKKDTALFILIDTHSNLYS